MSSLSAGGGKEKEKKRCNLVDWAAVWIVVFAAVVVVLVEDGWFAGEEIIIRTCFFVFCF